MVKECSTCKNYDKYHGYCEYYKKCYPSNDYCNKYE